MDRTLMIFLVLGLILFPVTGQAENECRDKGFKQGIKHRAKAHRAQQKKENELFREKVKNVEMKQRYRALVNHRETQFHENIDFRTKIHKERMRYFQKVYECRLNKRRNQAKDTNLNSSG